MHSNRNKRPRCQFRLKIVFPCSKSLTDLLSREFSCESMRIDYRLCFEKAACNRKAVMRGTCKVQSVETGSEQSKEVTRFGRLTHDETSTQRIDINPLYDIAGRKLRRVG